MRNTEEIAEETLDFGKIRDKSLPSSDNNNCTYTKTTIVMDDFKSSGDTLCRTVYQREIDFDMICSDGESNRDKMRSGKAPHIIIYEKNDDGLFERIETVIELHHLTQREILTNPESSMTHGSIVELPARVHDKYDKVLHIHYTNEDGIRRSFRVDKVHDEEGNHEYKRSVGAGSYESFRRKYWMDRLKKHEETERL